MDKILIYGVGSFKNRGCEALFNSTLAQIDKDISIQVASFDLDYNKTRYLDRVSKYILHAKNQEDYNEEEKEELKRIEQLPFDYNNYEILRQRQVAEEIKTSDLCIHIGGDNYSYGASRWLYALNNQAKKENVPTVLWGASLYDEITDLELASNLNHYDLLILRETISYNAIKKYISEDKLLLKPDPAFSLNVKKINLDPWYKNRKVVGLNLSPLTIKSEENLETIFALMNYILNETEYSISLIPHVVTPDCNDLDILRTLYDKYQDEKRVFIEKEDYDCEEIKYVISNCDLMVAARTHASIAAYSTSVPTLVLGYSVKSRGIAKDLFGNFKDYVISPEELITQNTILKFQYLVDHQKEIKKILDEKMKTMKKSAETIFEDMNKKLNHIKETTICRPIECTGCSACVNCCPTDAISMVKNKEGYYYPKIDLEKCIHCDLCRKTCPVMNKRKDIEAKNCYAVKSKDESLRKKSSSGGVFTHLADAILKDKGSVYGAMMNDFVVHHVRITKQDELDQLRGSKYALSNIGDIFRQVKKDLEKKQKVLFSGTPCQVAGLRGYLKKDYPNLYVVSLICHGVMNSDIVRKRVDELEQRLDDQVENLTFKSKKKGWSVSNIEYQTNNKEIAYPFMEDSMMYLYLKNYDLRECCYNCKFKDNNNQADLILGDYWNVAKYHEDIFDESGVSAVIIKTEKGQEFFESIKDNIESETTEYQNIADNNIMLTTSVERPDYRVKIFNDFEHNTMDHIVEILKLEEKLEATKQEALNNRNQGYEQEIDRLNNELNQIKNSKRWRITDKIFNIPRKIIRVIKRK